MTQLKLEAKMPPHFTTVTLFTTALFLGMQLFAGVVRWVLDMTNTAVLAYVPNVLMLLVIMWVLANEVLQAKLKASTLLFLLWLALGVVVGSFNTSIKQSVFGLWVLLPFFFGLSVAPILMQPAPWRPWLYTLLFVVAAGGVIVHNFFPLVWVGLSYSVGGVELEGAREWHVSGGVQRLSGFARSSFDVAGQLMVAAGLLSLYIRHILLRLVLWVLCAIAISLSTSKGILLALIMTAIASEALLRDWRRVLMLVFTLGTVWLFLPPILGWSMDWSQVARTDLEHPLYGSFIDRMNDMWPRALDLIIETPTALLGRGIGGIGVPLSVFEPTLANAGDNLWVYALVLSGVLCLPFFILGLILLFKLCAQRVNRTGQEVLLLAVMIMWYGGVSNILEHAILALAFGIVCRYLTISLSAYKAVSANLNTASLANVPSIKAYPNEAHKD